jgi:hypothetical protein
MPPTLEQLARFGDLGNVVRVKEQTDTIAAGISGNVGVVYGYTTPSIGRIEGPFIGPITNDLAYAVRFDDRSGVVWIAPDVLEVIDIQAGMRRTIAGYEFVKREDRTWALTPRSAWRRRFTRFLGRDM